MPPEMWIKLKSEYDGLRAILAAPSSLCDMPDVPRRRDLIQMAKISAWAWFLSWEHEPMDYHSAEVSVRSFLKEHFELAEFALSISDGDFSEHTRVGLH